MKNEKSFGFEIIKKDINDINKKLSVLEQVLYNIDLVDSNEFLVEAVSETIEEVKGYVDGISSVINLMIETDLKFWKRLLTKISDCGILYIGQNTE